MGIRPGRLTGIDKVTFDTLSTATFREGSLVNLTPARLVREYASTDSQALGIAAHNSVDSLPAGKVVVFLPKPGETYWGRLDTGISASSLSAGIQIGIAKSGNTVDTIAFNPGSAFSRIGVLTGRYAISPVSEAEFAWNTVNGVFYAGSINTFAS